MHKEIERKFLVLNTDFIDDSFNHISIKQGFLNSHKKRTVRVRIIDDKGFLTIKGKSNKKGTTRLEFEKEIEIKDAEALLNLCEKGKIIKTRYLIKAQNHIFEVDVFKGENKGLIIAEIELQHENESFKKPTWLGKEVTGQIKYYNSVLTKNPYNTW